MTEEKIVIGLTSQEASERLQKHGLNQLETKIDVSWLKIFVGQFTSPLIYILVFAGIITYFLNQTANAIIILLAILINSFLGFFQEFKAEQALQALQKLIISFTWVLRDGKEQQIPATQLVCGDLIVLKTGHKVPADGILHKAVDLFCNEAILTGESVPIKKTIGQEVFMGTVVVNGRGYLKITKTGSNTKMGTIASKVTQTIKEETPLKIQIIRLSRILGLIIGIIAIAIFLIGIITGRNISEMFTLSVALAIAAIPEGLVVSVTTILALGMRRLLKAKALVRQLIAAETLGSVSCICLDKTGTLTQGTMKVIGVETKNLKDLVRAAFLCNNKINPLENTMFAWAKTKLTNQSEKVLASQKRLDEIPFSSKNKYITTLYQDFLYVSGAPEKILSFCKLNTPELNYWQQKLGEHAARGHRVVAFAFKKREVDKKNITNKDAEENLTWLGFLIFEDPVRKEVAPVLVSCQKAGIKMKVVTGDYKKTAVAIINELGIVAGGLKEEQILEGEQIKKMSPQKLLDMIDSIVLFCRTTPEDKIKIVQALQQKGEVVAMMGDGVNDALALKKADIGVVVGQASEVAKEIADLVLLDSDFKTLVSAIRYGRAMFENIRKVLVYLLSDSFAQVGLVTSSLILGLPLPILPAQILWVNLIEHGLPGISLAFDPEEKGLMRQPPRKKEEPIMSNSMIIIILIVALFTNFALLGIFYWLYRMGLDLKLIRTVIFACLGIDSLVFIFSCRSLKKNIWEIDIFKNKALIISFFAGIILMAGAIHLPILQKILDTTPTPYWILPIIILFIFSRVAILEIIKYFFKKKNLL